MILLLPILVIVFVLNFIVAGKFELIAFQKGYDRSIHSFAMCFWLGIVGYLYVIALPNLKTSYISNNTGFYKKVNDIASSDQGDGTELNPYDGESLKGKYDELVARAELVKAPYFDNDDRIRTYESIVREMQDLASINFEGSVAKLEEYSAHLEWLKTKRKK